jgi:hypothetical protein
MITKNFKINKRGGVAFIEGQEVVLHGGIFSAYACFYGKAESEDFHLMATTTYCSSIEDSIDDAIPYLLAKSFRKEDREPKKRGGSPKVNIFGRKILQKRR